MIISIRHLDEHNLLNPNQSGFRPKDSCIYQLIEITHNIFPTFDCNPTIETRAVFLDISKAFDKVWHKGLLYKLESMGISGNLSEGITSNVKLFADDTSILSTVCNINISISNLNSDLRKVSEWEFKWKMSFNPDPTKQAQEVIFSRKLIKPIHHLIKFNNLLVRNGSSQKHLGLILDEKLNFEYHSKEKCVKFNKGISIIKKLQNRLARQALLAI